MKKYFLLFTLFSTAFSLILPNSALARKKYRYIKREHGVKFEWRDPTFTVRPRMVNIDLEGAYTYNWKGMLEFGPYFGFSFEQMDQNKTIGYNGGLIIEYNFIKNRGKRKLIPALGLKLGVEDRGEGIRWAVGPHGALKYFVGKRTPLTAALGYRLANPFQGGVSGETLRHNIDFSVGFSYYFDFY